MNSTAEETVCVTGVTGFLGSWVVQTALEKGLTVHGTCRNKDKAYFLTKLDGASERLKLFSGCDLSEPDSFREAIKGCETVIHTASPFFRVDDEVEGIKKLVEPAVEGTRNVLNCCSELGVKKVVLTSSTAAVYVVYGSKGSDHVFSEADWSDEELLKAKKNFYSLSKTRAEKLAWEISNQDNCSFKLSVMNPCLIFGPMIPGQTHLNTSCMILLSFITGDVKAIKQECMNIVDVRDVARAHVVAAQQADDWKGWGERFLLVGNETSPMHKEVVRILQESKLLSEEQKQNIPKEESSEIPEPVMGAVPPNPTKFNTTNSLKSAEEGGLALGKYYSNEEMVNGTVQSLIKNGFDSLHHYTLNK